MTSEELFKLQARLSKATDLTKKIEETNLVLENMRSGKCSSVKFTYMEVSDGRRKGEEEGVEYERTLELTPKSLDIPENEYDSLFANQVVSQLEGFKGNLESELANL